MNYPGSIKRIFDLTSAAFLVLLLSPLLVVLIIIGSVSFGNPFFVHRRAGLKARPFPLVKFKSMRFAPGLSDEERITTYGRFIRRFSLDELPQLFNVLAGHMSLVGPRPLPLDYVARMTDAQRVRLTAMPGITGLAQISGRNSLTWEAKFQLDSQYSREISALTDARILLRTIPVVIGGGGIQHPGFATMPTFEGSKGSDY
jgi:sugar transferase EpsL